MHTISDSPTFATLSLALALLPFGAEAACEGVGRAKNSAVAGGRGEDPAEIWTEVAAIIDRAGENRGIPAEKVEAFKASLSLRYRLRADDLSGRILLPTCSQSGYVQPLAFAIQGEGSTSELPYELRATVGDAVEMALVDYVTLCMP